MKAIPSQIRLLKVDRAQQRFMKAAGFRLTDYGTKDAPEWVNDPKHLVQWERGNLKMVMRRTHVPTIRGFTDHLINQVYNQTTTAARPPFPYDNEPCFPTTNEDES